MKTILMMIIALALCLVVPPPFNIVAVFAYIAICLFH